MEATDMEDLPSFFSQKTHVPDGVTSLIGELEDAGLLDEEDENLEMNMETFGAASMADIEQEAQGHGQDGMSLEQIEAAFKASAAPTKPKNQVKETKQAKKQILKNDKKTTPPPPPGFQGKGNLPPPVLPPPGMMIPIGIDPETGKTIHAPHNSSTQGMQPPPMKAPPGQNIWNMRAEQQKQHTPPPPPPMHQNQRQQNQHQNQNNRNQNYQQRNQNQYNNNNSYNNNNNNYNNNNNTRPYIPKTPYVALPSSVPKRGKMMSGGEVATVLHAHMRSLEITDPYREDFYYHHFMLKERRRIEDEMNANVLGAKSPKGDGEVQGNANNQVSKVPLPVWQETKEKLLAKKDKLWNKFAENTKEWEEKNKVFGHTQKSNPHRPRALLNLSSKQDEEDQAKNENGEEEDGNKGDEEEIFMTSSSSGNNDDVKPFSDQIWGARKSIEDAKIALLIIDELRRLLSRKDMDEIHKNKTNQQLGENFQILQKALGFNNGVISDIKLLEAIIKQDKGKKLLSRVFKLLPSQAALMLPLTLGIIYLLPSMGTSKDDVIAKYNLIMKDNNNKNSNSNNMKMKMLSNYESEEMFLNAVIAVINTPPIIDPNTLVISKHIITYQTIKACMESIVKPHISGNTLSASLRSKQRVEVVQALMVKGESLIAEESDVNKQYWKTLTKAFLELASKN